VRRGFDFVSVEVMMPATWLPNLPMQPENMSDREALPNVKDEPRRDLARLVPNLGFHSIVPFRNQIPSHEA